MDHPHETLIINQLPYPRETKFSEETTSSIGGQQEMFIVSDVTDRALEKENDARKRVYYMELEVSPPLMASTPVEYSQRTPTALGSPNPIFSPNAQQVENYVNSALSTVTLRHDCGSPRYNLSPGRASHPHRLGEVLETQARAKNINAT